MATTQTEIYRNQLIDKELLLTGMSRSIRQIYLLLEASQDNLKINDIAVMTRYSDKTIRNAINKLLKLRLIFKIPDLSDMRSFYYKAV